MKPKPTPPPMAEQLVPDDIWDAIAPLLPTHPGRQGRLRCGSLAGRRDAGGPSRPESSTSPTSRSKYS
jgi:hypothetical protein